MALAKTFRRVKADAVMCLPQKVLASGKRHGDKKSTKNYVLSALDNATYVKAVPIKMNHVPCAGACAVRIPFLPQWSTATSKYANTATIHYVLFALT